MQWQSDEFGASHEGWASAVLSDGSEPTLSYFDAGSGSRITRSVDWWTYNGTLNSPKARDLRGACSCGWRGATRYPIDWSQVDWRYSHAYDAEGPYEDWARHITEVTARSVPLPDDVEELVRQLAGRLDSLAHRAPLAALKAAAVLERVAEQVGRRASLSVGVEASSYESTAQALGAAEQDARSRLLRHRVTR